MAILNILVGLLFALGIWGRLRALQWHRSLLAGLAVFDIVAEFFSHGFFFITASAIVAVALLIFIRLDAGKSQPQAS